MTTQKNELWRDLFEIRQVLKEVALRHNISDEDDESHLILDEMKEEVYDLPKSLKDLEENQLTEKKKIKNIFERIDVEEVQKIVTKELIGNSIMAAEGKTVEISFDISTEVFAELALQAHINDKKFNDFIVEIIMENIKKPEEEEKSTT
jgi:hypothetical protein